MLEDAWGPSPFCRLHLVVSLSNVGEYRCLRGPPPSVDCVWWRGCPKGLNIDAWNWQGALPFLSIVFGSEAIKGSENIDTWRWSSPQWWRFGEYRCLKLTESSIEMIWRVSTLEADGFLDRTIGEYRRFNLFPSGDQQVNGCSLTAHIQYHPPRLTCMV